NRHAAVLCVEVVVAPDVLLTIDTDVEHGPAAPGRLRLVDRGELAGRRAQPVGSGRGRVLDVVEVEERDDGEDHEDRGRADGPADLERRVPPDLVRVAATAGA